MDCASWSLASVFLDAGSDRSPAALDARAAALSQREASLNDRDKMQAQSTRGSEPSRVAAANTEEWQRIVQSGKASPWTG
jgi:hypothetical protein